MSDEGSSAWNMAEKRMETFHMLEIDYLDCDKRKDVRESWEAAIRYYEQVIPYLKEKEVENLDKMRSDIDLDIYQDDEGDAVGSLYDHATDSFRTQISLVRDFMRKVKVLVFKKGLDVPWNIEEVKDDVESAVVYYRKYS